MPLERRQSQDFTIINRFGRDEGVQVALSDVVDSGVAVHAGRASAIVFMVEATERWPRAPAPGLRLLIVTAATCPV